MSLVLVLASCAALVATPSPGVVQQGSVLVLQEPRGKVAWFQGSYDELLAKALESKRIVFLDFYSRSNPYSRKLEKITYCDARVVSGLADFLCFSVDADSKDNKALRKRFQVQSAPALVFLDPDGSLRDQISGYFAPEMFLMELERIRANKETFSDLRARIHKDEGDLDARWALACKLQKSGDLVGYEEQVAEIRARDPKGTSMAARRMKLDRLYAKATADFDLEPLYDFVAQEKDPVILFEGWTLVWTAEGQAARSLKEPEQARMHQLRYFAAARALWPLVPKEELGYLGNNIAWSIYENRSGATRSDLEFALSVAQKAVETAPKVPAVVDTFACCLFAVGKRDEALVQVKRCIELDEQNPEWRERLAEFQGPR
jgi:thiol-disulfide isomerase/thioredoxin